ncbi:MAG: hypothetical protein QOH51_229 [Acidobacteriota bacterium]|jgi:hypothetical protein|nr:hypothetical protein [Acidobacteriota bacterium]
MPKIDVRKIFAPHNRGILLDVAVFVFQLILMTILVRLVAELARQAQEDNFAKAAMGLFFLSLALLQPIGTILKRRRARQRQPDVNFTVGGCFAGVGLGTFFVPQFVFFGLGICYLAELVLDERYWASLSMKTFVEAILGKGFGDMIGVSLSLSFLLMRLALAFVTTRIVWAYFSPPEGKPRWKFFESPQSEILGDLCIFLNMICAQIFWGLFMRPNIQDVLPTNPLIQWLHQFLEIDSLSVVASAFPFIMIATYVYLPMRAIYLAEDGRRPLALVTMLLAYLIIFVRLLFAKS